MTSDNAAPAASGPAAGPAAAAHAASPAPPAPLAVAATSAPGPAAGGKARVALRAAPPPIQSQASQADSLACLEADPELKATYDMLVTRPALAPRPGPSAPADAHACNLR
jgi:hypothetical protein